MIIDIDISAFISAFLLIYCIGTLWLSFCDQTITAGVSRVTNSEFQMLAGRNRRNRFSLFHCYLPAHGCGWTLPLSLLRPARVLCPTPALRRLW